MSLTVLSVGYPLAKVAAETAGGAEHVLLTIDRALVREGHRSLVLAPAGSRCRGLLLPVNIPGMVLDDAAKREARRLFKAALDRALVHFQVDVVHMHGIDFHEYLPKHDVPVLVSLHLPLSWYRPEALRKLRPRTRLICVSESQRKTAGGVQITAVVPNGVDRIGRSSRHKGNYAAVVGRICPEKGIHLAIDAAKRAHIDVILAGTVFEYPEHRRYFAEMIRPRLSANVRFVGSLGAVRKAQLLAGAKCLLIASQAPETSSLVAMEALSAGTPVIAWNCGALPEIVTHGRTGFIVSSIEEMAAAIRSLEIVDRQVCRREAEHRFSCERMTARYFDLYKSLAAKSRGELQAA